MVPMAARIHRVEGEGSGLVGHLVCSCFALLGVWEGRRSHLGGCFRLGLGGLVVLWWPWIGHCLEAAEFLLVSPEGLGSSLLWPLG